MFTACRTTPATAAIEASPALGLSPFAATHWIMYGQIRCRST